MPTPSFEKRLRKDAGKKVEFTYSNGFHTRTVVARVTSVEWDASEGQYFLVGRNTAGNKKNGSMNIRVSTDAIIRPVRRLS